MELILGIDDAGRGPVIGPMIMAGCLMEKDTGIKKWNDLLKTKIKNLSNLEISCEHKADENHIAVSAASILAKCVREEEMQKLREKYGNEIGSGYTSDPSTQQFLKKHAKKYNDDGIFRKSWATWKNANNSLNQKTL